MVQIAYGGTGDTHANYAAALTAGDVTYTQYTWDDNDHFYKDSAAGGGAAMVATTMAGFEGTAAATETTPGLLNHKANGSGSWTAGDLDAVTYDALSGNISVFKLGE